MGEDIQNSESSNKGDLNQENEEKNELEEIETFVKDLELKIAIKSKQREENIQCNRPSEEYFNRLDSSLKKNTAFVKKVKQFTAAQLDILLKDMEGLNLNKYITEICSALSEAKMKMSDVPATVSLCSKLHQTYTDFDVHFLEAWQKILSVKPGEKISNASKLRVDLRLFAELVSSGVINAKQGLTLLGNVLRNITQEKEDHSNFPIMLSFCRHCGEEYAGLVPKRILDLAQKYNIKLPKSEFISSDKQHNVKSLLKDYFKTICSHVLSEHTNLIKTTKGIRRALEAKGEISNERKEQCELLQANFDKLFLSAQSLSELLAEPLPELSTPDDTSNSGIVLDNLVDDPTLSELDPWGDEETKTFYVDLPDLRQFLPNYCAPKQDISLIVEPPMTEDILDNDIDPEQLDVDDPPSLSSDNAGELDLNFDDVPVSENPDKKPNSSCSKTLSNKQQFDQFLHGLNKCVNKELIDSAAIEFILNFNTKNNRKKVAKYIFGVQRTRLDLFTFFARFVAILNLVQPEIAIDLADMLKKEFKWHIKKKNQLNIESKIKIVRFIGEMVKFRLFPKIEALFCLKILLHDFQHHQIEMACAFIEVAGVYLYNCPDTRFRMNIYLDQMIRLKTATALDSRHAALIESVYYLVKPPECGATIVKIRTPVQEYIRHLVFEELCKQNVDKCIKLMRRLNWDDPEVSGYAIKCLSKAYLLRFPLIRCLADLVAGLSSYQDKAMVKVIDNVFDDIRAGLEIHSSKLAQRRIAMAKYLGELYNYRLIESANVLNTLYSIISLGVFFDDTASPLDPPDSLFRLKLACVLLETSGQYFTSTASRKRLDYFLIFFQHYYWYKKSNPVFSKEKNTSDLFPILVDHMYRDCMANVRPKLKLYKSLEEASEARENVRRTFYPQFYAQPTNKDGAGDSEPEGTLEPIKEDSEEMTEDTSEAVIESGDEILGDEDNDIIQSSSPIDYQIESDPPQKPERSLEDIEFEKMFEKMSVDSYQERLKETIKPSTKDIPVPMMAKQSKKLYNQIKEGSNNVKTTPTEDAVPFVLMIRGGKSGKQQFKTFKASSSSQLAVNLKIQEQKIQEEKEKVKRLTLNITERIEEEDYQESLLQQKNCTQNRFPKQNRSSKFKHPKGAPDADLIFH